MTRKVQATRVSPTKRHPKGAGSIVPPTPPLPQAKVPTQRVPTPALRRLRAFAFDPSLETLDLDGANQVTVSLPWEELKPGPIGEFLEVIDVDPASDRVYPPIDLNQAGVLAEDGIAPSSGNPGFHQQMVYAVAMATIGQFERALGRPALWSARRVFEQVNPKAKGDRRSNHEFVGRLRMYPHALREANAYYSPSRKAILFGYFPARPASPGMTMPGGAIFTCLSHDVIAHETTHALVDGLHPRFLEASNKDVLAFHEAFADIVALFQRFSYPEVLRQQLTKSRGNLRGETLLAQLAQQVGRARGQYGALRDAIGEVGEDGIWRASTPDPTALERTLEPHARGAILVAAVFDAFVSVYQARTADLMRIASNGTGVLPEGEPHPDLVSRLAREAAATAQHLLTMCIRALDYCPPVDIHFGEFLRALVTADLDLVHDDCFSYRLALIEAFRKRGIYPRNVRGFAEDSLRWRAPDEVEQAVFDRALLQDVLKDIRASLHSSNINQDRRVAFDLMRQHAAALHRKLETALDRTKGDDLERLSKMMGLEFSQGIKFEVHAVRPAYRTNSEGHTLEELVVIITQRKTISVKTGQAIMAKPAGSVEASFQFRGGCTLIIDPGTGRVRYAIYKNIQNPGRQSRQLEFVRAAQQGLRMTYFAAIGALNEPLAMLHGGEPGGEL